MSTEPTNPTTDDLAAYLDGELGRDETLAIESRLATDPALRRELGQLQKAWDLLDVLPRAKADETFSTTTMSLAAEQLQREAAAKRGFQFSPKLLTMLAGGLIALLSLGGGYYAIDYVVQRPKREIERELHLLSNFETYGRLSENFLGDKNLEFLKLLESSGIFASTEGGDWQTKVEPTTLDALSPEERTAVVRSYQTIQTATDEKVAAKVVSMRSLAAQIGADPARIGLLRTYDRYFNWLEGLPGSDRRRIESAKVPSERLELVRARMQRQNQERLQSILAKENLRVLLTQQDYEAFRDWLIEFIAAHEAEFAKQTEGVDSPLKRDMEKTTDPNRRRMLLYAIYVAKVGEKNAVVPSQEDFQKLTSRLSDEAKKEFSAVQSSEEQRRQIVGALHRAAFRARFQPPPSEADLAAVLGSLSKEEREKLERLKAMDLRRELVNRYDMSRASSRQRNEEKRENKQPDEKEKQ